MEPARIVDYTDELGVQRQVRVDLRGCKPRAVTPPIADTLCPGTAWRFAGDFLWWDGEQLLRFRRGYAWDGADVPWACRWYEGRADHLAASGAHDWCYGYHFIEVWDGWRWVLRRIDKGYADMLWRQILEYHYGVRLGKRWALWAAVAGGGWLSWLSGTCRGRCDGCEWRGACPLVDDERLKEVGR